MSELFSLEGMDDIVKKLEAMGKKAGRIENQALRSAAEPVLKDMKDKINEKELIRTGKLKEGLKISKVKKKLGTKYVEVGIGKGDISNIFYGKFLEWGTSKIEATPFMQPAIENNQEQIKETIKAELKKGLGL